MLESFEYKGTEYTVKTGPSVSMVRTGIITDEHGFMFTHLCTKRTDEGIDVCFDRFSMGEDGQWVHFSDDNEVTNIELAIQMINEHVIW